MSENQDRPIIQSHGYNGREPTRICPHCHKEKPAKSETNLGVKIVDNLLYIKFQAGLPSRLTSLFCINIEFLLF